MAKKRVVCNWISSCVCVRFVLNSFDDQHTHANDAPTEKIHAVWQIKYLSKFKKANLEQRQLQKRTFLIQLICICSFFVFPKEGKICGHLSFDCDCEMQKQWCWRWLAAINSPQCTHNSPYCAFSAFQLVRFWEICLSNQPSVTRSLSFHKEQKDVCQSENKTRYKKAPVEPK